MRRSSTLDRKFEPDAPLYLRVTYKWRGKQYNPGVLVPSDMPTRKRAQIWRVGKATHDPSRVRRMPVYLGQAERMGEAIADDLTREVLALVDASDGHTMAALPDGSSLHAIHLQPGERIAIPALPFGGEDPGETSVLDELPQSDFASFASAAESLVSEAGDHATAVLIDGVAMAPIADPSTTPLDESMAAEFAAFTSGPLDDPQPVLTDDELERLTAPDTAAAVAEDEHQAALAVTTETKKRNRRTKG
jgi:hypothetical protein